MDLAGRVDGDELKAARDGEAVTGGIGQAIHDSVLEPDEHPGVGAEVVVVDQHSSAKEVGPVAFKNGVDDRVEQRMLGTDDGCRGEPFGTSVRGVEADAFIVVEQWRTAAGCTVALPKFLWYAGDLVATWFCRDGSSADVGERFEPERTDVVGLQWPGLCLFHL